MSDVKVCSTPQFSVQRADLVRELSMAINCVERKTTIPILGNVLLKAEGELLTVTTTDLEMGVVTSLPAKVGQEGSFTLPAKRLLDYVRLLPEGIVDVTVAENGWAAIKSAKSRTRIPGLSADSFPELPKASETIFEVKSSAFDELVSRTIYAISHEESRFTLNGALMQVDGETLKFVSTDGHRMAVAARPCSGSACKSIIPRRAMSELSRLVGISPVESLIAVSMDDNHLFFSVSGRLFVARKMSGNFPDYERVTPKDLPNTLTFNREEMLAALGRVMGFADERSRSIRFTATPGQGIAVKAQTEAGESEEIVDATSTGTAEPFIERYNAVYLKETLGSMHSESVVLSFKDRGMSAKIAPVGNDDCFSVIMPMRI